MTPVVKVCGITRREDAIAAAGAGATALGFIFYPPSPRYVTPELAAELGAGLEACKVGVFVDETAASIESVMRAARLDVAQIYGGENPTAPRVWRAFRVNVGQVFNLQPVFNPLVEKRAKPGSAGSQPARRLATCPTTEAILLDGAQSGTTFDWTVARGAAERVIVAGGLDASNVAAAIRAAEPWGVDASSRLESAPGIKDHEKVRRFVAAARQAFAC
jgi:phosphoribosylanthranilate isomerase